MKVARSRYSLSMSGPEWMVVIGGVMRPCDHSHSSHWSATVPCASNASTAKKCSPSGTFVYVFGEVQFSSSTPSSQHQKVAPLTSAVKVNVWFRLSVTSSGPDRMIPSGGCETTHVNSAGVGSKSPAASLARTRRVCEPRVRSENCSGVEQEL